MAARSSAAKAPAVALVFAERGEAWLAPRTLRALSAAAPELRVLDRSRASRAELGAQMAASDDAIWLVRAGTFGWGPVAWPEPSSTGRSLCALGAATVSVDRACGLRGPPGSPWREALEATGGDLGVLPEGAWDALPIVSACLDATV